MITSPAGVLATLVAIASAANVGGAASAPIVAAYHRESLVPAAILMALIGYALGNYLALLTAHLCRLIGGGSAGRGGVALFPAAGRQ